LIENYTTTMFKLMECVARVVFCTPTTPEGYSFEDILLRICQEFKRLFT
jgi:hypothetical protein